MRLDWTYLKYRYFTKWGTPHTWDRKTDMWYFYTLDKKKRKNIKTIQTTANVDIDERGNVVGIELFGWDNNE